VLPHCKKYFSWQPDRTPHTFCGLARAPSVPQRAANQGDRMEATMELTMRLNVLAALLSFGFIAAIVFGVI